MNLPNRGLAEQSCDPAREDPLGSQAEQIACAVTLIFVVKLNGGTKT